MPAMLLHCSRGRSRPLPLRLYLPIRRSEWLSGFWSYDVVGTPLMHTAVMAQQHATCRMWDGTANSTTVLAGTAPVTSSGRVAACIPLSAVPMLCRGCFNITVLAAPTPGPVALSAQPVSLLTLKLCLLGCLYAAATPPQGTSSIGPTHGMAGRHMLHGLLHTCADIQPATALWRSSGGQQHGPL